MKNSTAENVLKKTFAYLDEIIEEKKQDDLPMADMSTETEDSRERMVDTTTETVE